MFENRLSEGRLERSRLTGPRIHGVGVGPEDPALAGLVDGAGLLVDDGKLAVDGLEGLLAQLVGLVHVRLGVRVGCLEHVLDGLAEAGIGAVDDVDGLLAERIGLEVVDAAGDGGVGGDFGEGLGGGRAGAINDSVAGGVRHGGRMGGAGVGD